MTFIVFILYIVLLFVVGFLTAKKTTNDNLDYFLQNRTLKKFEIGLSAGATGNSGFIMTGAVGLGYVYGTTFILLPIMWFLGDLIFWKFFPHKLNEISKQENIISPVSYISKNKSYRKIISIFIIGSLTAYAISQFFASSKTLNGFFGLTHIQGVALTTIAILVYLVYGGFRASVKTDIIQAIMMLFTTIFLIAHVLLNQNLSSLKVLPATLLFPFQGWGIVSILGFVLGWIFAAVGFGLGQPQVISRYFAGSSSEEVKGAKWIYIVFLQITWVGMTLFGFLLKGSNFLASDPESAVALYSKQFLNPIISGLIIAGVFSSIASTVDSMVLSISTSIKIDLFDNNLKLKNNLITLGILLTIMFLSLFYNAENNESIVFILSKLSVSLLASSLGLAFFIKIVFKNISDLSIITGTVFSVATCLIWYKLNFSVVIVESFPAIIIGLLVVFLFDKLSAKWKNV